MRKLVAIALSFAKRQLPRWAAVSLSVIALSSHAQAPPPPDPVAAAIQSALAQGPLASGITQPNYAAILRFYSLRAFQPAWIGQNEQAAANTALQTLKNSAAQGLEPSDYHLTDLERLEGSPAKSASVLFELALTESLLHYESDVHLGRVSPQAADSDVSLPANPFDPVAGTHQALIQNRLPEYLAQLPPQHPQYHELAEALARYRAIEARGGWQPIDNTGTIRPDLQDPRAVALRARLALEDPSFSANQDDPGNGQLTEAIRRYQARNNLRPDGIAGHETLVALNVPVSTRISTIIVNMERWRWMPRSLGTRYIAVNAADASLRVVQDGKTVIASRVIVGRPRSATPIFDAMVTGVTVNPYWNVPPSIARNEILPKVRRNPGYLASHHMFIDGSGAVRQSPGADNALGYVKLEMPNRFNSYLHDTPARKLFARDERHLSHGCIRVEQIQPLASFALTGDPVAGFDVLQAAIGAGNNKTIPLDKPLPVFVLYWTAIAGQEGTVGFRSDVYGRDQRLLAALAGQHLIGRMSLNTETECWPAAG